MRDFTWHTGLERCFASLLGDDETECSAEIKSLKVKPGIDTRMLCVATYLYPVYLCAVT